MKVTKKILEYVFSKQDDFARIANLITTIKLRLNPKEHAKFLYMLDYLDNISMGLTSEENNEHRKKITIESQRILKKRVVKSQSR
ncbi:hypothetical protein [Aeromonas hydrophila]|uniref:hypothetical protein n=1 Tax=Aeromonas hydrophila TaxID=644 RepID=UPI002443181C|nr:hypothetical protein [Aeromonas hydrophila]